MTKKGYLAAAFLVGGSVAASYVAFVKTARKNLEREDDAVYPASSEMPLTKGEKDLAKSIFGGEIDTTQIRKYFASETNPSCAAETLSAKKVKFYGERYQSADYTASRDPYNYGLFVREMTRVWQLQHFTQEIIHPVIRPNGQYEYKLSPQSRFQDFGVEQQASIIQDYALNFLYPRAKNSNETYLPAGASPFDKDDFQSTALLKKVVEARFPQARRTRLGLEAKTAQKSLPQPKRP